jgi:catechol 2,3-dioxygenase-like lactoylglutathione lyase family enzyme
MIMGVELNHTIVSARDKEASARFLADVLGLADTVPFGPFMGVEVDNGVTLDFADADGDITPQHYAFLVSEENFDEIFGRIRERGLAYWADPARSHPGQINTRDGGRGVYWDDPDGHFYEILTRPYGRGGWRPPDDRTLAAAATGPSDHHLDPAPAGPSPGGLRQPGEDRDD